MLPKDGLAAQRHFRKLRSLSSNRENGPAVLALTLLHLVQAQSYPALVKDTPVPDPLLADEPVVIDFASWLSCLDTLTTAFWLSSAYASWIGKSARAHSAMFFTPPSLSMRLIDDLVANGASLLTHVWLDPASGGAAFLAPVAQRIAEAMRAEGKTARDILKHLSTHVIGNDIDSCLAFMSKQFLRMVLYDEINKAGFEPQFTVTTQNALTGLNHLQGKVDVVICNPPYRKMNGGETNEYRSNYAKVIAGQPNLYALFFKLSLDCLKSSGIAGLLTPTSYFSGQYFSNLRSHLLKHAEVRQLDIVPAMGAFVRVDQETAIAILSQREAINSAARSTNVYRYARDGEFSKIGICYLPCAGEAWSVPREAGDATLLSRFSQSPFRLSDYGYTARIGHFVWNRDTRKTFSEYPKGTSGAVYPLIWSSDVLCEGGFEHGRSQSENEPGKFVDMGSPTAGGIVQTPSVVLQRVTSSDQAKRLIGSPLPQHILREYGGVVGENHVIFLLQSLTEAKLSTSQLAEILRSKIIDRLFRCISGAVNVSIYELKHLPMPDPQKLAHALTEFTAIDEAVEVAFSWTCVADGNPSSQAEERP